MLMFYLYVSISRQAYFSDKKRECKNNPQNETNHYNKAGEMHLNQRNFSHKTIKSIETTKKTINVNNQNTQRTSDLKSVFDDLQVEDGLENAENEYNLFQIDMNLCKKISENLVRKSRMELFNEKMENLDTEYLKKSYKPHTWKKESVIYLVYSSLIGLYPHDENYLEKKIKESLKPDKINNLFLYNHFFNDDLTIKIEYLILLIVIPEINVITLLYCSYRDKTIKNISDVLIDEYNKVLLDLVNKYKAVLPFFDDSLQNEKWTINNIYFYFCSKLKHEINSFRDINNRILKTLLNDNSTVYNTNVGDDIKVEIDGSSCAIKNKRKRSGDTVKNFGSNKRYKFNDDISHSDNPKILKNHENIDDLYHVDLNFEMQENNDFKESENANVSNTSLYLYNAQNHHTFKVSQPVHHIINNKLYFFIFLNKEWINLFTSTEHNYLIIDFSEMNLNYKSRFLNDSENSHALHNNIYLFLNVFGNKYNTSMTKNSEDCMRNDQEFTLNAKNGVESLEKITLDYIYFMFDRYSEILLECYIGST